MSVALRSKIAAGPCINFGNDENFSEFYNKIIASPTTLLTN